eukprot:CAMPEP_0170143702 /NCGR_PEP_ID=MMETSP0033_2-20121228/12600_1 /TAXON_ID=195969 /ORGANISM="Dolichomastix tenuilepis, Strain CCMP3274" /LENGTH=337 /DNA_ID=CAMNT_0010380169 /DNA_START=10 /DNA_END=1023 /DNA_ORIENTATION=+
MNFAKAATEKVQDTPLKTVQIDGSVLLRIVKHCKECVPNLVTGQLLGLDIGSTLEVTSCFPFMSRNTEDEEQDEEEAANYQLEVMRCLREVNVDNNTVGWYQSTYLGSFQTVELIETFLTYQENIKRCVCIIYDPLRSAQGALSLRAIRLTEKFMDLYRDTDFTAERVLEKGLSWGDIFQEIPVTISNSALVSALMGQLAPEAPATQADYDRVGLSADGLLEKNMEFLTECMDDLQMEQQRLAFHQRNLARQQVQQAQWIQKRRAENLTRRSAGQEPLPEEEPGNPLFKSLPEPSRLDTFLICNQVNNYCSQINQFSTQALTRLYLMDGIQKDTPSP